MSETAHKIYWVPLESNPQVLNEWAGKSGLDISKFQYHDIFGLDEELLSLIPQPVKAIVLLFPSNGPITRKREDEVAYVREHGQHPIDPGVLWIKQTIGNACGAMGLLHAMANSDIPIQPDSPLANFIRQCRERTPLERSKLLETTPAFSEIHAEFASGGQTVAPKADAWTGHHYTCFVSAPDPNDESKRRLIELDGDREGPFDRGECEDLLQAAARLIKEGYMKTTESLQFSLLALAPPPEL